MVLNEQGEGVIESVRQGQWRASFTASFTVAGPNVSEKFFSGISRRRFGESRSDEFSTMIVRAAD